MKKSPEKREYEFKSYGYRAIVLKDLGFESYEAYQRSELWKSIRVRVIERDGEICQCCKKRPIKCVHHKQYDLDTLAGASLKHLVGLCGGCHRMAEFHKRGGKNTLREANKKLKMLGNMYEKRKSKSAAWEVAEYRELWHKRKKLMPCTTSALKVEHRAITKRMRTIVKECRKTLAGGKYETSQGKQG